jgi:hypothetical protein
MIFVVEGVAPQHKNPPAMLLISLEIFALGVCTVGLKIRRFVSPYNYESVY